MKTVKVLSIIFIMLGISFAVVAFSKEESMSVLPENCEIMDDMGEIGVMRDGIIVMTTCGPSLLGNVLAYEYDWDTHKCEYFCYYTGEWDDFCLLSQTTGYNE